MKYDFTSILDRHGWDSIAVEAPASGRSDNPLDQIKLHEGFDVIPMWVADMNFPTVPTIPAALVRRGGHPAYGYFQPRPEYFQCICDWHRDRHGVPDMKPENIGYENGVLGGVASALRVLCTNGEPILLHSPTYIGFTGIIGNNGWKIVHSPLKLDENGIYRMDFEDMERKIKENHIHTTVFCSPHNPTGRVWERWEIEQAMELFAKYDVTVISDEIWSDIIMPGHTHIPTQSVSEDARRRTVALYAPSKTFNLAGLIGSYHVIYDQRLRDLITREAQLTHYNSLNVMSMHALIAAYSPEGAQWVDELCQVLDGNIEYAVNYIRDRFEGVTVTRPEGTYMLFLDCGGWCEAHGMDVGQLLTAGQEYGVIWQDGRAFHGPNHIRMNLALPKSRVEEAFRRLDKYVFNK